MRLLIYGLNYAPEMTGVGKYTGEMAAWLAARGHEVEVICGLPHYPQWKLDAAYADGHSRVEQLDGVRGVVRARGCRFTDLSRLPNAGTVASSHHGLGLNTRPAAR
ncbi:MAG TPA: hypothetical protein ENI62_10660 [Gammaproteobacteria bacterium]|nr:hypothetical protein [Gammaproteobacteria bacterium]